MVVVRQLSVQCSVRRGLRHRLLVPRGVVPEVGNRPRSSFDWSLRGSESHDPDHQGRALYWSGWPFRRVPYHGSHPVVGRIVQASSQSTFGRQVSYPLPPRYGVVSLVWHGTGIESDRAEVTVVPSVLVGSVWHACSCQSRCA
jgi:hypothetical protein